MMTSVNSSMLAGFISTMSEGQTVKEPNTEGEREGEGEGVAASEQGNMILHRKQTDLCERT